VADVEAESEVLARCLGESGYTPPVRALPALLAALAGQSEQDAERLERALARAGDALIAPALSALAEAAPAARAPLLSLLLRLAGTSKDERLLSALIAALAGAPREQRLAARALGKLGDARAEPALLGLLERAALPEQRALVDALGLVGGPLSRQTLQALAASDPELERRRVRALLLLERRSARERPGSLLWQNPLGRRWDVALTCRRGVAEILAAELSELELSPRVRSPARVEVRYSGSLEGLLRARTALQPALIVALPDTSSEPPEEIIAAALARPEVLEAFARWTRGVPRFRLEWTEGGHQRALTWALARALARRTQALVNDSQRAPWTVFAPPSGRGQLLLAPHLVPDPRFAYRQRDVPAASHPTLAAALARSGGVRPDDVVWDPFVGSALELIERARLGPHRRLIGSDIEPDALAAARANLDAAGVSAELLLGDARTFEPGAVSLIISNPPMGRRVARDASLADLLARIVERASEVLVPGGRLVWLSPLERLTRDKARAMGLEISQGPRVDMGGFEARVQVIVQKP
jgi:23S rRNA G2445 N2-methylase RlmL